MIALPAGAGKFVGRAAAALALAVILAMHVAAAVVQVHRLLDHDEGEYLHAGWLMAHGKRIYRDFMEDHPPYLYQLLNLLRPSQPSAAFPLLDVPEWTLRGRTLMVIFGTLAAAAAGTIAWRAGRSPIAGLVTFAVILASHETWTRGILEMRADAPTLFLFWLGAMLVVCDDGVPLRSGMGIALIAASQIWNPKWPLESLVIGIVFLRNGSRAGWRRPRTLAAALLPTVAVIALMLLVTTSATTLGDYVYYNFLLKSANMHAFRTNLWVLRWFQGRDAFFYTTDHFRGAWPVVGIVALAALLLATRRGRALLDSGPATIVLLLAITSFLELRFLYTWPRLWSQYLLMWAFALSVVYGTVAGGIIEAARRYFDASAAVVVLLLFVAIPGLRRSAQPDPGNVPRWDLLSYEQRTLRPGDTIWVGATVHPIAAPDTSYFWYSMDDLMPMTMQYVAGHPQARAFLPAVIDRDLPLCAVAGGRDTTTRFLEIGGWIKQMPVLCDCAQRLVASGRIVPTAAVTVYEVLRVPKPLPPETEQALSRRMKENCRWNASDRKMAAEIGLRLP